MLDIRFTLEESTRGCANKDCTEPIIRVKEGSQVHRTFYDSVVLAREIAQRLTGRTFDKDIVIETVGCSNGIRGKSATMMIALQLISKLIGRPLRSDTTGSAALCSCGLLKKVEYIAEKVQAAKDAGKTIFIIAKEQAFDQDQSRIIKKIIEEGKISIIRASIMEDCWALASYCKCAECAWRRSRITPLSQGEINQ